MRHVFRHHKCDLTETPRKCVCVCCVCVCVCVCVCSVSPCKSCTQSGTPNGCAMRTRVPKQTRLMQLAHFVHGNALCGIMCCAFMWHHSTTVAVLDIMTLYRHLWAPMDPLFDMTHTHTNIHIHLHVHIHIHIHTHTRTHNTHIHTNRQTDKQTNSQTDKQTNRPTHYHTNTQTRTHPRGSGG